MKVCSLVGVAALVGYSAAADFSLWTDSSRVLVNTTAAGADVAVDVANFPVLVRLTAADFIFSEARTDGADLRFADSLGAPLAFEIERFDAVAKIAEAWVMLPMVKGNSSSQWFRMYWGNATATSSSSGPSVFAAVGNYAGVWHLGEDAAAGSGAYKDVGGSSNHGTSVGLNSAGRVSANIGRGTLFSGAANQGIEIPHNASLHPTGNLTVEAWIKSTSQGPFKRYLGKPFTAVAAPWNEYSLEADGTGAKAAFSLTLGGTEAGVVAGTNMVDGSWYHVVGTYDGASQKIYVNGVMEAMLARTGTVPDYGQALSIGKYELDNNSNFDGTVDEARVSRTARSADWIKLEYANQKPGQKLIGFQKFAGCQSVFQTPSDTTVKEGATLQLNAKAECASGYNWEAVSGPAPRIFDPEVKSLNVIMPRVARDTVIVYRFSANVGGSNRTGDVRVTVKEAIPDPAFSMAAASWNGSDTLKITPTITNMAAMTSAGAPALHYAWTVTGLVVDTIAGAGWLGLSHPTGGGSINVGLCLDDGGIPVCKQATVTVSGPAVLLILRPAAGAGYSRGSGSRWDASGRSLPSHVPRAPRVPHPAPASRS